MKKNILVVSHERSGTHFLINTIARNFTYPSQQIDMDNSQRINWKNPEMVKLWMQQFRGNKASRIFKSHHGYPFLAPLFPGLLDDFHIFYISRDGRDVMTSFWVYLNRLAPGWGPRAASVGDFMRSRAAGGITQYQYYNDSITMLQRWVEHVGSWTNLAQGVHCIAYEELHTQFNQVLDRVAGVLDQPALTAVRPSLDAPSSLPWRGSIGAWREYFTAADEQYFNEHVGAANT